MNRRLFFISLIFGWLAESISPIFDLVTVSTGRWKSDPEYNDGGTKGVRRRTFAISLVNRDRIDVYLSVLKEILY
jgi:hypothetical protein